MYIHMYICTCRLINSAKTSKGYMIPGSSLHVGAEPGHEAQLHVHVFLKEHCAGLWLVICHGPSQTFNY